MILYTWRLKDRKFFLNFSSPSIRTKNEVSSCKNCWILSFLSLNTWITKRDRKDNKERQFGRVWQSFGLTEWVTKRDMNCKVRQDGLQNVPEITNCDRITKRDGAKPSAYIHCLIVKFIISRFIVWKKFFWWFITFSVNKYIIADMIRDIFSYTFLINVPLNFLQYHTNKNSSFKNS